MKRYEKFSIEELKEILKESNTFNEALIKLGYTLNNKNKQIIKGISSKYNISIAHFINGQTDNLIGKQFGRLTVLKKVPSKRNGARWLCKCSCEKEKEVDANHLKSGNIKSCGCLQKETVIQNNKEYKLQDLKGQKFGKLTVLYRAENIGDQPAWVCKCDCGVITSPIMGSNLRRGQTQSCGCLVSQGELKIRQIFKENNIIFKTQVYFKDCISDKNAPLRFDFGVYNEDSELQYLIEYQGRQHYTEMSWTSDTLQERQKRDQIKIEYCKKNNIPLLIIPYTKYKTLNINDLILEREE